jgi:hypothetical protein
VIPLEEIDTADAFIMLKVVQTFDFIIHNYLMSEVFLLQIFHQNIYKNLIYL